jgi:hypothetical protein
MFVLVAPLIQFIPVAPLSQAIPTPVRVELYGITVRICYGLLVHGIGGV